MEVMASDSSGPLCKELLAAFELVGVQWCVLVANLKVPSIASSLWLNDRNFGGAGNKFIRAVSALTPGLHFLKRLGLGASKVETV